MMAFHVLSSLSAAKQARLCDSQLCHLKRVLSKGTFWMAVCAVFTLVPIRSDSLESRSVECGIVFFWGFKKTTLSFVRVIFFFFFSVFFSRISRVRFLGEKGGEIWSMNTLNKLINILLTVCGLSALVRGGCSRAGPPRPDRSRCPRSGRGACAQEPSSLPR